MIENKFHEAYAADVYFQPTVNIRCRNCGTRVKIFYAESRLYAVKCGYCETITLVKARNPAEAARYVGEYANG